MASEIYFDRIEDAFEKTKIAVQRPYTSAVGAAEAARAQELATLEGKDVIAFLLKGLTQILVQSKEPGVLLSTRREVGLTVLTRVVAFAPELPPSDEPSRVYLAPLIYEGEKLREPHRYDVWVGVGQVAVNELWLPPPSCVDSLCADPSMLFDPRSYVADI